MQGCNTCKITPVRGIIHKNIKKYIRYDSCGYTYMEYNYTYMEYNYTYMEYSYTYTEYNYTYMEYNHTYMEYNYTYMEYNYTYMEYTTYSEVQHTNNAYGGAIHNTCQVNVDLSSGIHTRDRKSVV